MMLLSELNTLPDFTPVNASSFPLPSERITRGRGGRYSLPRTTLSFATFQRLTPTLRTRTRTRTRTRARTRARGSVFSSTSTSTSTAALSTIFFFWGWDAPRFPSVLLFGYDTTSSQL